MTTNPGSMYDQFQLPYRHVLILLIIIIYYNYFISLI